MNRPARKPLRRTAWSMLLSGLGLAAVMIGVGLYVVGKGAPVGPDQPATWPAGTEIAVFRPAGPQQDNGKYALIACTASPENGRPRLVFPIWAESLRPDFSGSAILTCPQSARVLTGSAITVAAVCRGPLIAVPLFAAGVGALFFFPRFTAFAASISHPFGRIVTRVTGRERGY
jgi:hypothetical protein